MAVTCVIKTNPDRAFSCSTMISTMFSLDAYVTLTRPSGIPDGGGAAQNRAYREESSIMATEPAATLADGVRLPVTGKKVRHGN
jgi:hypothetical protein